MKHANRWDLPKGHLDQSETKIEAAYRELKEETGIESELVWRDPDFEYTSQYTVQYSRSEPARLKELTIFLGVLYRDAEIITTEHLGHRWFRWSPPHAIQSETIDPLLEQVARHWEKNGPPGIT
ncbi:MAG: NUDIX domain-containing protein [Pirellula sp.]|nr:NUDIX domain-containing protein [Pirellula sp.]